MLIRAAFIPIDEESRINYLWLVLPLTFNVPHLGHGYLVKSNLCLWKMSICSYEFIGYWYIGKGLESFLFL